MPIQYIYPSGDVPAYPFGNSDSNPNVPYYRSVDEGVLTYNDADYNFRSIQYPLSAGTHDFTGKYLVSPPLVVPDDIASAWIDIRCKVAQSGMSFGDYSVFYSATDASGKLFYAYGPSTPQAIYNTSYQTLRWYFSDCVSGNVAHTYFGDFTNCMLELIPATTGVTDSSILYISAVEVVFSGENIMYPPNNNTDLFISGPVPSSGNINDPTLFISGPLPSTASTTLYINGIVPTGLTDSIPLYLLGSDVSNSGVDLFIQSSSMTDSIDLFIAGHLLSNSGTTLFIDGTYPSGIMPMSIIGTPINYSSGNIDMFITSTTNSSVYNISPLSIFNSGFVSSVPMFLNVTDRDSGNEYIPLVVKNDNTSSSSIQLFLSNSYTSAGSGIKLRTIGAGQNDGWNVGNASMPLFINRTNDSMDNNISMYIQTPSGTFETVPFVMSGGYIVNSSVELSIPSTVDSVHGNVTLRSHGF